MTPKEHFVYYEDYPPEKLENCEYDVLPCRDLKRYYDTKTGKIRLILAENVISADTRLFDLIDLFNEEHTVYFVKEGKSIVGLVHYSDLKKHPVRVLFYLMVAELESNLRKVLETYYGTKLDDAIKKQIKPEKLSKIEGYLGEDRKKNENLRYIDYLYLEDLRDILLKDMGLWSLVKSHSRFSSKNKFESNINPLIDLRNWVAHPVKEELPRKEPIYLVLAKMKDRVMRLNSALYNVLQAMKEN
ncbi:hypothetical protein SAMN05216170_1714 [Thermococcus thioreducens]|nr:hypothetical protein SAMN05216170_1714 [Thermococcus thioreducens]